MKIDHETMNIINFNLFVSSTDGQHLDGNGQWKWEVSFRFISRFNRPKVPFIAPRRGNGMAVVVVLRSARIYIDGTSRGTHLVWTLGT